MPIKFRCSYCRQFLGISRAQAGGVVDCPSCGRSIRVPLLDGTVQPMEEPELNLEDTHLARALDELARLADSPVQKFVPLKASRTEADENEAETQIPQPLLEPIPIEVPLPPTPLIIQPPMNAAATTVAESGAGNDRGLLAELATLSAGLPNAESLNANYTETRSTPTTGRVSFSALMVSVMVLSTFLAGMLTERFVRVLEGLTHTSAVVAGENKEKPPEGQLTGRITYKSKAGESQPDRGARILVFPLKRSGQIKLSAVGFRPADNAADQQVADAALKALGGAAATADAEGRYRLPVEAGSYRLLVLSHFQPRDDAAPNPELGKMLSEFFEKPEELLGKIQYQFSPLRIKGVGDVMDHSF